MTTTKECCPTCGSNISEREIALYRGLVTTLWRVYNWAAKHRVHEFTRKDIKHLFENENDTARFGDLVLFGGLVYKLKKGVYGLNLNRCDDFFAGKTQIYTRLWKNPVTKEIRKEEPLFIHQIPSIMEHLNEDGEYVARYQGGNVKLLV